MNCFSFDNENASFNIIITVIISFLILMFVALNGELYTVKTILETQQTQLIELQRVIMIS